MSGGRHLVHTLFCVDPESVWCAGHHRVATKAPSLVFVQDPRGGSWLHNNAGKNNFLVLDHHLRSCRIVFWLFLMVTGKVSCC